MVMAAAFTAPTAGWAEVGMPQYPQASGNTSQIAPVDARWPRTVRDTQQTQLPDLVVISIGPVAQPMSDSQRRESTFRALDANSDGEVTMAEAGVNTSLLNAFQKLDHDGNRTIDRQEFARAHVDDGSSSAQASSAAESSRMQAEQSSSAAGGSNASIARPATPIPSKSIEERSRFSIPGETHGPASR
jgi:hypothetical protein